MIGASRSELLEWINATFNLNYTKIEQCGNGAVYCEIFNSIYNDLPMHKVNYQPSADYQILNNYKILQSGFSRHSVSREVPVDRLMKFRLQDNLEFLQWLSKLWSENKLDGYEASGSSRRRSVLPLNNSNTETGTHSRRMVSGSSSVSTTNPSRRVSLASSTSAMNVPKQRISSNSSSRVTSGTGKPLMSRSMNSQTNEELIKVTNELKATKDQLVEFQQVHENLETERNFYFNKLRDIEILSQNLNERLQADETVEVSLGDFIAHVQEILYSTAEGFQVPEQQDDLMDSESGLNNNKENGVQMIDDETF
ncbi:hypothetical protein CANARDRAFT_28657, partial [[Candida] arabinofermentans NRRL YB-2248]